MGYSILHLIDSLDPAAGGPVEFVKAISKEHARMGHRVCAGLLTRPGGPPPEGLEIAWAGRKKQFGGYGFDLGLTAWLRHEAHNYDAVFVHGLWQYHGAATWLALSGADIPYYLFPHGMLDPWFLKDAGRRWKKRAYWEAVERHAARSARAVLFTSEAEMERAQRSFGLAGRRREVVELGIAEPPADAEAQRKAFLAKHPQLEGKRIILFLGRLDRKKGCDLLARMKPQGWELVFAGPCRDAEYRRELEGPGIHFTGMLEGEEKWGAFRCGDVFALPSHQENFGMAVAEALGCGVPVLLSTAVGIHQTITRSGAGFADRDDAEGTRRLLERWSKLPAIERDRMRTAAVNCFRAHFHIRATAARLLSLVEHGPRAPNVPQPE